MSDDQQFSKEKRILMAMRKTLARIIRDLTPSDMAVRYPLSDQTVEDIKACFDLITARERELMEEAGGQVRDRPQFIDEPHKAHIISIDSVKATMKKSTRDEA